ncbi:hypothetical protein FIBSPDRAFT_884843 [Athelia psychrophila]|uniref:GRF-type domain-containing protein n=1 Tax=Athelia psychrophila TaxID=1759441 RepID=A0A166SG47_9AGAM|nr:hypothetical protein FIBSPDRAFT_884843 [Fibularhizoctonia sp. CBS 109695]
MATPPVRTCSNCHRADVKGEICKSDLNGNKGRLFYKCSNVNRDGVECSYFRWGRFSPSSSLIFAQSSVPDLVPTQAATQVAVNHTGPTVCTFNGSWHLRHAHPSPNEQRPTHISTRTSHDHIPAFYFDSTNTSTYPIYFLYSRAHIPTSFTPVPSTLQTLDAWPHPHYPSHITPIFTQSWEEYEEATIAKIQDSFITPYFKLTEAVLEDAGFTAGTTHVLLRNALVGMFARVKVGHVMTFKEKEHVFLKAIGVTTSTQFNERCEVFGSKDAQPSPHFRDSLPAQRNTSSRPLSRLTSALRNELQGKGKAQGSVPGHLREFRRAPNHQCIETSQTQVLEPSPTPSPPEPPITMLSVEDGNDGDDDELNPDGSSPGNQQECPINVDTLEDSCNQLSSYSSQDEGSMQDEEASEEDLSTEEIEVSKIWPSDYYVVDMVQSFRNISDYTKDGHKVMEAFGFEFLDNKFVSSSFYDHVRCWKLASQASKDVALAYGRSRVGLWSAFMENNPHPYANPFRGGQYLYESP